MTGGMISKQPFYSSGPSGEFTMINGGYQPVLELEVSRPSVWTGLAHSELSHEPRL